MKLRIAGTLSLLGLLVGCKGAVDWRYYAPFRVIGTERAVSPVDPAEVSYAGVASNLHYVSLTIDSVFYRNLPGTSGRDVAIGIELEGALPKGSIKSVSEPSAAKGQNGLLFFERPFAVDPFLYRGKPLRLTLTFRDVTPAESKNLKGRLQALGLLGVVKKLAPGATAALTQHATQFESFLGKAHKGNLFKYTFSLYPSDMEGVRQDLVLTGGRHVFIGIPASDSPESIKKVKPADLIYKLRLVGRRLEWRHNNKEYTESPYVLLSIIRYKRYPDDETRLRKAVKSVDRYIEQENWKVARANMPDIGAALIEEKQITQHEKNLEIAWRDVREARIRAGETAKTDKPAHLAALVKQIKLLGYIGKDFATILEPFEVKKIRFQIKRLSRQAVEIATETNSSPSQAQQYTKVALASVRPPVEAPKNPRLGLKPPKVVTVTVSKPDPFYKKWWFYALVGGVGAALITGTTAAALSTTSVEPIPIPITTGKPR